MNWEVRCRSHGATHGGYRVLSEYEQLCAPPGEFFRSFDEDSNAPVHIAAVDRLHCLGTAGNQHFGLLVAGPGLSLANWFTAGSTAASTVASKPIRCGFFSMI